MVSFPSVWGLLAESTTGRSSVWRRRRFVLFMWRDGFLVWRTGGEGGAGGREERSDEKMLNYSHQDGHSGLLPLTAGRAQRLITFDSPV